jgi:hypothetical protein
MKISDPGSSVLRQYTDDSTGINSGAVPSIPTTNIRYPDGKPLFAGGGPASGSGAVVPANGLLGSSAYGIGVSVENGGSQ